MPDNFDRMNNLSNIPPDELRNMLNFDQNAAEAEEAMKGMESVACIACPAVNPYTKERLHTQKEAFPMACCKHVAKQDQWKPDGIVYCPNNLVLCFTCLRLWRAKRVNIHREITMQCGSCIMDEVRRVRALGPNLVVDLRTTDEFKGK